MSGVRGGVRGGVTKPIAREWRDKGACKRENEEDITELRANDFKDSACDLQNNSEDRITVCDTWRLSQHVTGQVP